MANDSNQIDELQLDIKVNTDGSEKKIRQFASAISRLDKAISTFSSNKLDEVFGKIGSALKPFEAQLKVVSNELQNYAYILKRTGLDSVADTLADVKIGTETTTISESKGTTPQQIDATNTKLKETLKNVENTRKSFADVTSYVAYLKLQLENVNSTLANGNLSEKKIATLKKQQLMLQRQINAEENKGTKKPLSQILKSFARISFYRIIRSTIKNITQAFQEGIGGIAQYDKKFSNTITNLTSSFAQVKASISVALYQPLMIIQPVIIAISQGIVQLSNGLSYLGAKLRGESTFLKINTEYLKEYNGALNGTLLSFDTFEKLGSGGGIDYSKMFIEGNVGESSLSNELGKVKIILEGIAAILAAIGTYKLVKWIESGGVEILSKNLKNVLSNIKNISNAGLIASSAFGFVFSIINLIDVFTNWDSKSTVQKILGITAAFAGLAAVIFSIVSIIPGIGWAKVAKGIAVASTAGATILAAVSAIQFAKGGIIENSFSGTGTMYAVAGEAGAEVVAQGSQGTGVLNVEQFADAMVSALARYGAARDGSGATIEIDGNRLGSYIASSSGFRNEANRRNANLNWR